MRLEEETKLIKFVNIYNVPLKCEKVGKAVTDLMKVAGLMQIATIIIRDFNFHYMNLYNRITNLSGLAIEVADWVTSNKTIYALDQRTITHN